MAGQNNQIGEKVTFDDDQMIVKRTFSMDETLKDAQYARERSMNAFASD